MERVQSPGGQLDLTEVPSLGPFSEPAPLAPAPASSAIEAGRPPSEAVELLALTARSTPGVAGREALTSLHAMLGALLPSEENATLLLRLLDEGAFNELRGDDGTLTRELAVETLLGLGYPWALRIHPDELAWYRTSLFLQRRNKLLLLLGIVAVGGVAELFLMRLF